MMPTERFVVRVCAVLAIVIMVITCFFTDRSLGVDDLAMYNPIYTYLHDGRMTFPAQNQFYYMVVHPPLHYLIIAELMKLGISLYYAQHIPTLGMTLLILALIERSKFPVAAKLGFIFAVPGAIILSLSISWILNLRPDLHLALAWFAGLLALESARLDEWDRKRLFLGGFLLTASSGLHYFGAPGCLGSLVYIFWVWKSLGFAKAWSRILVIIAGACLFGIPYLLLFVIPNWQAIRVMVSDVQSLSGLAGVMASIQRHYETYEYCQKTFSQTPYFLTSLLMLPTLWLKIPLLAVSTVILASVPAVRGLALAGLPLPLFVFFYSQAKSWGYYIPEILLYLASVLMAVILLLQRLGHLLLGSKKRRFSALVAVTVGCIILSSQWIWVLSRNNPVRFQIPFIDEMDVARASSRELMGSNALVSSSIGLWYISGGKFWYDYAQEVLIGNGLKNPTAYFSIFDAIAGHHHMSNASSASDRKTLLSFYLNKTLHLKGFYLSGLNSTVSQLFFSTAQNKPLEGYAYRNSQLLQFREQPQGEYLFVSTVCPSGTINNAQSIEADFLNRMLILDEKPTRPNEVPNELVSFLIRQDAYQKVQRSLPCQQQDRVAGTLQQVDVQLLLQKSKQEDSPIQFFQSFGEAKTAAIARVSPEPIYSAPSWEKWQKSSPDASTKLVSSDTIMKIKTDRSNGATQIISPIIQLKKHSTYLSKFSVQIQEGGLGIQILDKSNRLLYSQLWCKTRNNSQIDSRFVFDTLDATDAYVSISNCVEGTPRRSRFELKSLKIFEAEMNNNNANPAHP